jgi:hypothetical protein
MRRLFQHTGPKARKTWAVLMTLIFVIIFAASPLLHNHEPSIIDHTDCPAFHLMIHLLADADGVRLDFTTSLPNTDLIHPFKSLVFIKQAVCQFYINRAPPSA